MGTGGGRANASGIYNSYSDGFIRSGAKFDLWDECVDYKLWSNAFAKHGMDADTAGQKNFGADEILPWEHLGGPDTEYLLKHFKDAIEIAESD